MFQLGWYFYLFFALLATYVWAAYFAYLYKEKGRRGLIIGSISLLIAVILLMIIYKRSAMKKTKRLTQYDIVIYSNF